MAAKRKEDQEEEDSMNSLPKKREKSSEHNEMSSVNTAQGIQSEATTNYTQFYEQRGNWAAYYDWRCRCYYYMNMKTSQTQWEQPSNWGRLPPVCNPWRQPNVLNSNSDENWTNSEADSDSSNSKASFETFRLSASEIADKLAKFMERPAKRQVDPDDKKKVHWIPEGATEYNIWYDRWVGEHWRKDTGGLDQSETRCCLETDAGYTKANIMAQGANKHYYCLYFAKGCCHLGSECGFLHSIPTQEERKRIGLAQDCFGRGRHQAHKENMGGVGTFDKESCSLYVGGLHPNSKLEKILWTEFGEWGEIEDIRIIPKKHIAFVRYKCRLNAEFAKVAMADQRLANTDLLNVRWANEDPNPKAQIQEFKRVKGQLLQSAEEQGLLQELAAQPQPIQSNGPVALYPNTDHQYPSAWSAERRDQTLSPAAGPMTKQQFNEIQALDAAYEDCTRLDEAFKRIEGTGRGENHGVDTPDSGAQPSSQLSSDNGPSLVTSGEPETGTQISNQNMHQAEQFVYTDGTSGQLIDSYQAIENTYSTEHQYRTNNIQSTENTYSTQDQYRTNENQSTENMCATEDQYRTNENQSTENTYSTQDQYRTNDTLENSPLEHIPITRDPYR